MNALLLSVLVAAGSLHPNARKAVAPASPAPVEAKALTDDEIRSRIHTYLGTIDTPIPASRWQELGPAAEAPLLEIIHGRFLPSRRAKATDGLGMIGSPNARGLLVNLASDEHEQLVVRLAALRGLGKVLSGQELATTMQPLLETPKDLRVRAKAAEVLTRVEPARGCPLFRAQLARETEGHKAAFGLARDACFGK